MLTDIFAFRYQKHLIWSDYTEVERRLLNQSFAVVKDAIPFYSSDGKEIEASKEKWKSIHDRLARELGVSEISPRYYSYTKKNALGHSIPVSGYFSWLVVVDNFVNAKFTGQSEPDSFIKERLSFVEVALRFRESEIAEANANLPKALKDAEFRDLMPKSGLRIPGRAVDGVRAWNVQLNSAFQGQVNELNERFRRAGAPLTYHNGFIQVSSDSLIEDQIATPFWSLVKDPIWANVDTDMKEALDRRDSNDKDPAIFAAKALESAIKIISGMKGWTRGTESGAAQYIDNLVSRANGSYLRPWEGDLLKDYFRRVRNPLGHGPGADPMPALSLEQTDWAIETAMSWIRSLVRRI